MQSSAECRLEERFVVFEKILQILRISCSHNNTSKPFASAIGNDTHSSATSQWESVGNGPGHYVVCLDCGKKFAYDWANMRVVN